MFDQGKDPIVSIILPTYNRGHLVGRAVKSVLDQSYRDFEMIVVDDGSQDDTHEVIKSFDDPRIRYIRFKENRGAQAARNAGINSARGKFIAFQDSDNEWKKEKLEKQLALFKNAPLDCGVVYTRVLRRRGEVEEYIPDDRVDPKEGDIREALLKENSVDLTAALVKKECFENAGMMDESLPRLQDWELWIRLSKYYRFKFLEDPLVTLNIGEDSISADNKKLVIALKYIVNKHREEFSKYTGALARQHLLIAHLLIRNGSTKEGRDYLLNSGDLHLLDSRRWILIVLSFFGQKLYRVFFDAKTRLRKVLFRG